MPLGTNYDWSGMMGGYEDALSQLYRGQQTDFLDFLRSFAPQLGQFLQQRKLEKLVQQQRIGGALETGEGVVLPQDINMMGQAAPEMMPWEQLRSLVGTDPSPFPAGPMSVSKEAQRDLPPLFARSPYNEIMRQLDMEYKIARLRPKAKEEKELTPSQKMNQMKLDLLQKLKKGDEWTPGDIDVAARFWPDKISTKSGLTPSQQISQMKLDLFQKTKTGEAWTEDEEELAKVLGVTKEERAGRTLSQILPPDYSMVGDFVPPGAEFNMYRIRATERLGAKTGNQATMEEARKARIMKGYPPLEDERDMQKAIRDGDFGKTKEGILANLKTMGYPDDYIEFIMAELGIK